MSSLSNFEYNGLFLNCDNSNEISLTRLWEMAGKPENKEPAKWARIPQSKKLIKQICQELNVQKSHILKSSRGKGGSTSAYWKLALDYAAYLSIELKSLFYDWVKDRIDEESNPDLAVERGVDRGTKQWKRQGKSQKWIDARVNGIVVRHKFTDTLKEHGVNKPVEYAVCTDVINRPLLGGSAKEVKKQRNLPTKKPLRDALSQVELSAINLAEAIATEKMEMESSSGFSECRKVCSNAGKQVSRVFQ